MNYTIPRPTRGCQDLLKSASKTSAPDPRVGAPIQALWDSLPQKCKIVVASFLSVKLNEQALEPGPLTWRFEKPDDWLEFVIEPQRIRKGANDLAITLTGQSNTETSCTLHDVFLRLEHGPSADRRRDLTMSRNRYLAYYDSLV